MAQDYINKLTAIMFFEAPVVLVFYENHRIILYLKYQILKHGSHEGGAEFTGK